MHEKNLNFQGHHIAISTDIDSHQGLPLVGYLIYEILTQFELIFVFLLHFFYFPIIKGWGHIVFGSCACGVSATN